MRYGSKSYLCLKEKKQRIFLQTFLEILKKEKNIMSLMETTEISPNFEIFLENTIKKGVKKGLKQTFCLIRISKGMNARLRYLRQNINFFHRILSRHFR